ncbi:hypothetical protein OUZ56_012998 [Daphnia magna]|uniref:Uncharacterized protein n=1 Tax=Daphnia magna TaxID=35525 RepID=A0ABQ9Z4N0_9CRUS|nr:hypothetical protein OUZ56_012998 [Daphnia magna]
MGSSHPDPANHTFCMMSFPTNVTGAMRPKGPKIFSARLKSFRLVGLSPISRASLSTCAGSNLNLSDAGSQITPKAFVADLPSAVTFVTVSLNWTSGSLLINSALLEVHLQSSIFAALKIVIASRIRFSASSIFVSPPSQSSTYNCCCSCRTVSGIIDPDEPYQLPVLRADLNLEKRLSYIGGPGYPILSETQQDRQYFRLIFQLGLTQQPLQPYHSDVPVGFDPAMAGLDGEQHHVSPIVRPQNRLLIGLQECGFCFFLWGYPHMF